MGEGVKALLAKPIKLADQVAKQSGSGQCLRPECKELRARAEKLAEVLRQAARADLYERPAERIVAGTLQALAKAGGMSARCFESHSRLRRFLTFNPVSGFPRTLALLDTAIEDVAWLIRISSPRADADANGNGAHDDDDDLRGLPNIAQNEPILFLIWDHIARLHTGSLAVRADSASTLASLARDNPHFSKLIVEEDGIAPLVKLLKEGTDDGQEAAATALGFLGRDEGSVEKLLHAGVCSVYSAALKEPPMRVQAAAAEAIASLAHQSPRCQDLFAQNNAVRHLVGHLAAGTIQEHSRYSVGGSSTRHAAPPPPEHMRSLHSVVLASTPSMLPGISGHSANEPSSSSEGSNGRNNQMHSAAAGRTTTSRVTAPPPSRPQLSSNGSNGRGPRETEDPATKAHMKAMAAKALWKLARGHPGVCKSITESRALLCFARLLEKGDDGAGTHLQYYSAMAIMEITRVAEHKLALRQSAFKPSSPPAKAVAEQLLCIVRRGEYDDPLLLPCITSLGCLSRTFTASETRVIGPLVRLLDDREPPVAKEAIVALTKFACTENHLHVNHCRAIVDEGGARHLVQLVYLGDELQIEALILLCYIALHVPESEEVAQAGVLAVLLWASKQPQLVQDLRVERLLPDAKARLDLFQSRGSII
ncbi:uncharacterized protein LOC125552325 [Triticum urartu]|uniref:DUF7792 domain-containing protein n=1 Tax=Triticum urartu TaxID=4572 RepID=A0A8R7U7X4_TRIUA|nr:uncharacterized protein LOC125552325 [Triticum urartu]